MKNVKTTVFLKDSLFETVRTLSETLDMPFDHLISIALEEFILRHRNRMRTEAILLAYEHLSSEGVKQSKLGNRPEKKRKKRSGAARFIYPVSS